MAALGPAAGTALGGPVARPRPGRPRLVAAAARVHLRRPGRRVAADLRPVAERLVPATGWWCSGTRSAGWWGALAARSVGLPVDAVVGLGIKTVWSPAELAKAAELAARPVTWFATRDEAARRYLRVAGLTGLFAPEHPAVDAGLRREDGRWRLAMDPAVFAVGEPHLPALLAATDAPVLLARGEHDPMVTDAQLKEYGVPVATLPGLGHNAHVEDPAAVLDLLDAYR
ncbi:alpha/beta hydrolase [Micromonospora sp. R77]|uniref:alpha/beta fold hydrolase n=1 Tax=Micromonospora sp. R77 TaxID=2925836 RepID=UPI001F60089C|nr:alpha/beta hydrolase [Micromonospora sp. R77]MCI4065209.1 alpha/beta hydrolase [Micromonospora sp. R77]